MECLFGLSSSLLVYRHILYIYIHQLSPGSFMRHWIDLSFVSLPQCKNKKDPKGFKRGSNPSGLLAVIDYGV